MERVAWATCIRATDPTLKRQVAIKVKAWTPALLATHFTAFTVSPDGLVAYDPDEAGAVARTRGLVCRRWFLDAYDLDVITTVCAVAAAERLNGDLSGCSSSRAQE